MKATILPPSEITFFLLWGWVFLFPNLQPACTRLLWWWPNSGLHAASTDWREEQKGKTGEGKEGSGSTGVGEVGLRDKPSLVLAFPISLASTHYFVATGMKGNSTGHASAGGLCIPTPWHPLMLDLSLPWGGGGRWQIWPPCLEPGTSMAEATTRRTLSHDFGQEVCFSLLGRWNTACVTKFGERTCFLHFEVSLWSTCSLSFIPIVIEIEPNI